MDRYIFLVSYFVSRKNLNSEVFQIDRDNNFIWANIEKVSFAFYSVDDNENKNHCHSF